MSNDDFDWNKFDPEAYFQHYYRALHADDARAIELTCAALAAAPPPHADLAVLDVGTGPNLFPLLSALPRARTLTAWEYSPANIAWLNAAVAKDETLAYVREAWAVVRAAWAPRPLPDNPLPLLRERFTAVNGSIFDLPAAQWDAATMFFCAESITRDLAEFTAACTRFAGAVKPGGALVAAFLVRSRGYRVAEAEFPAVTVSARDIAGVFEPLARAVEISEIGLVEQEIASGYTGMAFLTARAA